MRNSGIHYYDEDDNEAWSTRCAPNC
jgi:hypothetical protein